MDLLVYLLAILLLPLIPAFILYKTLPAETNVKGPFKGLTINLSGAFAGYFLLVLIALGFCMMDFNSNKQVTIDTLKRNNDSLSNSLSKMNHVFSAWTMEGQLTATNPEKTKIFYDNNDTKVSPEGDFVSTLFIRNAGVEEGFPLWVCMYNPVDGFGVIRLNPKTSTDIQTYDIQIDKQRKEIKIGKPVALTGNKK